MNIYGFAGIFISVTALVYTVILKDADKSICRAIFEGTRLYNQLLNSLFSLIKNKKFWGENPKGSRAFSFSLLLAFIYPILAFVISYGFGSLGKLAGVTIIEDRLSLGRELVSVLLFTPVILLPLWLIYLRSLLKKFIDVDAIVDAIVGVVGISVVSAVGVVIISVAGVVGTGIIGVVGIGIVGVVGISISINISIVGVVFANIIVVVGIGVVGILRKNDHNEVMVIMFFYLVLPVINSIFDFISMRFSRFFIAKAIAETKISSIIFDIFKDFILALLLLISLLVTIIPISELISNTFNYFGTADKIDWLMLFDNTKNDPFGNGFFITLMIITTTIPTIVHLLVAITALAVSPFRERLKKITANKLVGTDKVFLSLWTAAVVTFIIWWLGWWSGVGIEPLKIAISFICDIAISVNTHVSPYLILGVSFTTIFLLHIMPYLDERNIQNPSATPPPNADQINATTAKKETPQD